MPNPASRPPQPRLAHKRSRSRSRSQARSSAVRAKQSGAAMLMAMLIVALVASLASAAIWQQWRSVSIEVAQREQRQGMWLLVGALDFVRLIFREDHNSDLRNGKRVDSLDENWALYIKESKLSTFLALDKDSSADLDLPVYLSGYNEDAQAKLNLRHLWENTENRDITIFKRLFSALQLPETELTTLYQNLKQIYPITPVPPVTPTQPPLGQGGPPQQATQPAPAVPEPPIYFEPQNIDDLAALGIKQSVIDLLKPHVTILPTRTSVNVNTASAEVLFASGMDQGVASAWIKSRKTNPIKSLEELTRLSPGLQNVDIKSDYFLVNGRIRIDQLLVQELSLIKRVEGRSEIVSRRRVPPIIEP